MWKHLSGNGTSCSWHCRLAMLAAISFTFFLFCIAGGNSGEWAVLTSHTFQRELKWWRLCKAVPIDDIHILVFTRHSHTAEKFLSFVRLVMNHVVLADHHVVWRVRETECERPRTRIFFHFFCHHHHHPCLPEKLSSCCNYPSSYSLLWIQVKWKHCFYEWAFVKHSCTNGILGAGLN